MEEYIKQFVNHTAYQAAESSLNKPNVSLCVQEDEVHYNPYIPTPQLPLISIQYEWEHGEEVVTDRNGSLIVWDDSNEFCLVKSGDLFMWYNINWEGSVRKVTVTEIDEDTTTFNVDGVDYVLYLYDLTPTPELLSN